LKIKVKKKRDRILVKVKFSSTDQISQRELNILSRGSRDFLLPKKLRHKAILFSGKQGVPLNRFLKTPLTRYEFYFIMAQIADITRKIESNELFLHNIILDLRYVFINQTTKELQFLYLPILSNHVCVDVRGFMESVIYAAAFEQSGGTDYVAQFADYLRNMPQFSSDVICDYIQKREKNIVNRIGRGSQSGFFTDKPADYYSHYGVPGGSEDTCLLQNEETTLLNEDLEEDNSMLPNGQGSSKSEETVLLDDEATTLLQDNDAPQKENPAQENRYPYLIRVSANEKISLCKPVFRLGKEKDSVDYFVYGNNAVSRAHADIVTRGSRYFVIDCNSTNKTYINDREVPPKIETEIHDGDILKLANEAFEFHLS
jgi:hypothetical protein